MAEVIEVRDPANYDAAVAEVQKDQDFVVVIVSGDIDPNTGKNWCGDCERAKDNIKEYVINQAQGKLLYCVVEKKESWKPGHFYKVHPVLKVKGVPTIVLLKDNEVVLRAENDEDFFNVELLTAIAKPE